MALRIKQFVSDKENVTQILLIEIVSYYDINEKLPY